MYSESLQWTSRTLWQSFTVVGIEPYEVPLPVKDGNGYIIDSIDSGGQYQLSDVDQITQ